MKLRGAVLGVVLAMSLAACATAPPCRDVVTSLYLGRSIAGGGEVSDAALDIFLHEEVVPRFPEGSTLLPAQGRWRDGAGATLIERSAVLQLVHCADGASDARVRAIFDAYRLRFRQEAVLWTESPARTR